QFEEIVVQVIDSVPEKFKKKVENLSFIIDDENILNTPDKKSQKGPKITLALYEGVPLTKRSGAKPVFPDKITIFKKAIESVCRNDSQIRKTIRRVVLHELGHYFGIGEAKLKILGY
ncbi:MAG: metallopeptidase family protein, partial [Actinobacteria bacterium]|nr:metallopeptidase family protein [Actinomycetota bacterium]